MADRRYAFAGRVELAHATLRAAGSSARLWATEFGWCVGGGPCGGVTEAQQARYTEAAVGRLLGDWRDVVEKSFVFTWNRTSNTSTDWTERFGLRRPDGSTRPAWDAFAKRLGQPMHSRSG